MIVSLAEMRERSGVQRCGAEKKPAIYEDVYACIKSLVRQGHYRPGDHLPGERELARQLGVSRNSLREALRMLSMVGVLESRQGAGTQLSSSSANVLKAPFEFLLLLEQPSVQELYETRELIEVHLAGRAAERRTDADLAQIKQALEEMRACVPEPRRIIGPNLRFHEVVASAGHHPILSRLVSCLHEGIRACIEAGWSGVRDWQVSYELHEEIYQAVQRQNPAAARRAMTIHMGMALENVRRASSVRDEFSHSASETSL